MLTSRERRTALIALGVVVASCTDAALLNRSITGPFGIGRSSVASAMPAVRFSELHYDNVGTDSGETIEISGPAGTNVTGWQILLYNGSGGAVYDTKTLTGVIPATCGSRGVITQRYPSNGIQNGSPDGMALVDNAGTLIEFLSYEGAFAGVGGPANGVMSVDIGVSENGSDPGGMSLARTGNGTWNPPAANTFGVCNDNDVVVAGPVASITVTPPAAALSQNATQQFTASASDAAGTPVSDPGITWTSSAPAIASIDAATGLATALTAGDATITATSANGVTGTASLHVNGAPAPEAGAVHLTEIHYDNAGTDAGEAIEIEGPAGANVVGWSVVLYNGGNGASYDTRTLNSALPTTGPAVCGARSVLTISYPVNGIQNGSPDGMALVDAGGNVVEFLSYEGTMTATIGPAVGMTSTDIGVAEDPNGTPVGYSLQRDAGGTWHAPSPATFGACNTQLAVTTRLAINELMADPRHAAGGASFGEWFEVHNYGATAIDLQGWTIASAGQPEHVISASVVVPAGGYAVLGRGADITKNGGITIDYNYFTGSTSTTIFLDATDYLALRDASGATVDSVRWTNAGTMVRGVTRALRDPNADNASVDGGNWGYSTTPFGDGDLGTPHAANGALTTVPPDAPNTISFSGRLSNDPALPIGFEDQLFATERDGGGTAIPTTFTWTSETPSLASIDAAGVMHALAEGTAVFRATATDGTTATYALPMAVATSSTTAQYGNNTEFGDPVDADASDDYIIRRPQYTTSFNRNRGTPNWVAYDLDASQMGSAIDRCDCFTYDPMLPASYARYTTADYTGAGAIAGYGIDRGHLARSFDRTTGSYDNATTFYFSNIIPQAADLNQGPWASMENYLGSLASGQNREVYIVAGVAGTKGTVKNEGRIVIPTATWKVAVIMPRDRGLADVHSVSDVEVIAVIMPNEPGVRNVNWETYKTTVDAVEALSGYDLLSLLPDGIEIPLEANDHPPVASLEGSSTGIEGAPMQFSAGLSTDPDAGDVLTYGWSFGDGTTDMTVSPVHYYIDNGTYTVTLTVTDRYGLTSTRSKTVTVSNAAPVATIAALGPLTVVSGSPFAIAGSFSDAGTADGPWGYTVSWGTGTPDAGQLADQSTVVRTTHTYFAAGSYTVTYLVMDRDGATGRSTPITVQVVRRSVGGDVLPRAITLDPRDENASAGNGGGQVMFSILSQPGFRPSSVDASTVSIGGVGVDGNPDGSLRTELADVNGDGVADLTVRFSRQALTAAHAITAATTELVLLGDLRDGTQITASAPVRVVAHRSGPAAAQ